MLCCLEKDAGRRPQSAEELKNLLLALTAAEWTPELRAAWWQAYDQQPPAIETESDVSTPMATVSIDLANRME